MADLPPYPDSNDDTGVQPTADRPPSTPRWVKVTGIIAGVLVLVFVTLRLTGTMGVGEHGPDQHIPSGDAGGQVAPSSVMEDPA